MFLLATKLQERHQSQGTGIHGHVRKVRGRCLPTQTLRLWGVCTHGHVHALHTKVTHDVLVALPHLVALSRPLFTTKFGPPSKGRPRPRLTSNLCARCQSENAGEK